MTAADRRDASVLRVVGELRGLLDRLHDPVSNRRREADDIRTALQILCRVSEHEAIRKICALASRIIESNPDPDDRIRRALKAHVDALEIFSTFDLAGDGASLDSKMIDGLENLAKAAAR